jgi:hypothetical protein
VGGSGEFCGRPCAGFRALGWDSPADRLGQPEGEGRARCW